MQRIKEAMGEVDVVFPILGHPMMWPNVGFIELPVGLTFQDSITPLPEHTVVRAANHVVDEQRKKKKDDEEKKWSSKQRAKQQQGKQRHGSSEGEEEEDDGFGSPIPWDDLATVDEDLLSP